jgi:hypothetical protein
VLVGDDYPSLREALAFTQANAHITHLTKTGAQTCGVLRTQHLAAVMLDMVFGGDHGCDLSS